MNCLNISAVSNRQPLRAITLGSSNFCCENIYFTFKCLQRYKDIFFLILPQVCFHHLDNLRAKLTDKKWESVLKGVKWTGFVTLFPHYDKSAADDFENFY